MSEYINREEFLESKIDHYCHDCSRRKNRKGEMVYEIGDAPCRACGIGDVLDDVIDFPAADVVEVVRCKDCKYYNTSRIRGLDGEVHEVKHCNWVGIVFQPTGYCSFGERRS